MQMLSISTTSVVKQQQDKWRGELRARDIDESPRYTAWNPDDTERARPHMHNDGHAKVQDRSTPGGDPGWLRAEPGE